MSAQLQGMLEDRICRELPHLKEEDIRALTPIVKRLIEAYQPERIYLFGSEARGDFGPDSDFDLLVAVPDTSPPEWKHIRLASEVLAFETKLPKFSDFLICGEYKACGLGHRL